MTDIKTDLSSAHDSHRVNGAMAYVHATYMGDFVRKKHRTA